MLKVKIADNPYTLEKGLMFVDHLPDDEGMLFVFSSSRNLSFWGKNTFIPLDIAFIDENNYVVKISQINIMDLSSVSSDVKCKMALEVNKGYFQDNGIDVGDKMTMDSSPKIGGAILFDEAVVYFNKEGQKLNKEKDNTGSFHNLKKSQTLSNEDKVNKTVTEPVGAPITEQIGNTELPVVDISELGSILEDSFDQEDVAPIEEVQQAPETAPEHEVVTPEKEYPVFNTAFEATEWAEQNGEVVRISYTTKHGRNLVRDVEPHGKFHSKSTHKEIMVTFDETVGDIRAFIVTNVSKWAFTGKKFEKKFVVKA